MDFFRAIVLDVFNKMFFGLETYDLVLYMFNALLFIDPCFNSSISANGECPQANEVRSKFFLIFKDTVEDFVSKFSFFFEIFSKFGLFLENFSLFGLFFVIFDSFLGFLFIILRSSSKCSRF